MPSSSKRSTTSKKPAKAKAARKAPARAKSGGVAPASDEALKAFTEAIALHQGGFVFDAVKKFQEIAKDARMNELADDALVNAGLCYMQMALYRDAIAQFTRVIQGYPDSTISAVFGGQEVGRTAAKALFCRLKCHLLLGDVASAKKDLESLKDYPDSTVQNGENGRKTFHQLAEEVFSGKHG